MKIRNISISRIKVKRGRRAVNKERVAQIAESISTLGLLTPGVKRLLGYRIFFISPAEKLTTTPIFDFFDRRELLLDG